MKKMLPWLRLGAFCFALFGISALAVLLKQGRLFRDQKLKGEEHAAGGHDSEATSAASLHGDPAGDAHSPRDGAGDAGHAADGEGGSKLAGGTLEAQREEAVASGRKLFDLPESISISEASSLMLELERVKREQDERKSALDLREKELKRMESEVEARRSEVLGWAKRLQLDAPVAAASASEEELDPELLKRLADTVGAMETLSAAQLLGSMPADKAALLLFQMELKKAGAVLAELDEAKRQKITEALLRPARKQE